MPQISRLRTGLAFFHTNRFHHRNYHVLRDTLSHGMLCPKEQHLRKRFGVVAVHQRPVFEWKEREENVSQIKIIWQKISHFHTTKSTWSQSKLLMCQGGFFSICLSLIYDVLNIPQSTRTFYWSNLLRSRWNLVAHAISYQHHFINIYEKHLFPATKCAIKTTIGSQWGRVMRREKVQQHIDFTRKDSRNETPKQCVIHTWWLCISGRACTVTLREKSWVLSNSQSGSTIRLYTAPTFSDLGPERLEWVEDQD